MQRNTILSRKNWPPLSRKSAWSYCQHNICSARKIRESELQTKYRAGSTNMRFLEFKRVTFSLTESGGVTLHAYRYMSFQWLEACEIRVIRFTQAVKRSSSIWQTPLPETGRESLTIHGTKRSRDISLTGPMARNGAVVFPWQTIWPKTEPRFFPDNDTLNLVRSTGRNGRRYAWRWNGIGSWATTVSEEQMV